MFLPTQYFALVCFAQRRLPALYLVRIVLVCVATGLYCNPMRPGPFYVAAGVLFTIAWFIFFDGLTFASRYDLPYVFPMWLPGILCLVGTIVFFFADPKDVQGEEDFLGGMTDEAKQNRAKITFFIGAVFCLAGLSVGIWKLTDTYNNSGTSWPGIALLLQALALIGVNGLVIAARSQREDDYIM